MLHVFSINRVKIMAHTATTTDIKGWREYMSRSNPHLPNFSSNGRATFFLLLPPLPHFSSNKRAANDTRCGLRLLIGSGTRPGRMGVVTDGQQRHDLGILAAGGAGCDLGSPVASGGKAQPRVPSRRRRDLMGLAGSAIWHGTHG
jgi:hypothetical protein